MLTSFIIYFCIFIGFFFGFVVAHNRYIEYLNRFNNVNKLSIDEKPSNENIATEKEIENVSPKKIRRRRKKRQEQ